MNTPRTNFDSETENTWAVVRRTEDGRLDIVAEYSSRQGARTGRRYFGKNYRLARVRRSTTVEVVQR
jgi:hypothetical protein